MMLMFMKCSANVEAKHQGCYRLAHWRSGTLTDGGAVDPRSVEGSWQEVLVCGGEGVGGGWRGRQCRLGGAGGVKRRWK